MYVDIMRLKLSSAIFFLLSSSVPALSRPHLMPPRPLGLSRCHRKVVLAEMSYRILLPDKVITRASSDPQPSRVAAGDRSDSITGAAADARASSSGDATAAAEEETAAPCAGVWGDVEVRVPTPDCGRWWMMVVV